MISLAYLATANAFISFTFSGFSFLRQDKYDTHRLVHLRLPSKTEGQLYPFLLRIPHCIDLYSALSFRAQALQIMEGVEEMEVMYQRCMKVSESTTTGFTTN